jgi:rhodanese-related sulfurtransferase
MAAAQSKTRVVVVLLAILGGVLPVLGYWRVLGRVPAATPEEAKAMLTRTGDRTVLVDVRTPEEFAAGHLDAARNWPHAEIAALVSAEGLPEEFREKRLLLICESGIRSALAARRLGELGVPDATNVQGGMQAWVADAEKPCAVGLCRLRQASGDLSELPHRESPALEQWIAVLTGFVIKPLYMTLSVLLVVVLWRERSLDLVALRWAMICFFVGEAFCAGNYLIYREGSLLFEFLHSYGMVLCFGLTVFALLEGIDLRLVKYSDPKARCAALSLCHRCIKHAEAPCGLQRTFLLMIPAVIVLCLMPFCARLLHVSYNTQIWGTFYNYSHPVVYQIFEIRYLPAAALLLLSVSWFVLMFKRGDAVWWSKVFFSAGSGALGFAFFRLLLLHSYRDDLVWFAAWEELTELLFVVSAGLLVLWFFRHGLFRRRPVPPNVA